MPTQTAHYLDVVLVLVTTLVLVPIAAQPSAAADDVWRSGTPESQGFSSRRLDAIVPTSRRRSTQAFLVIHNDTIVCEWYASRSHRDTKLGTASLAKAIVGGVSLAVALGDGRLALDDPAAKFIPKWRSDPAGRGSRCGSSVPIRRASRTPKRTTSRTIS